MSKNITRKQIINELPSVFDALVDSMGIESDTDRQLLADTISKMVASANRPTKSKPSAETLKNRRIAEELAAEINARGKEMTAAEVADFYTDPDGMTLNPRKVGALLRNAAAMGLVDVSPEKWSVKHYGPVGYQFSKKPVRAKKSDKAKDDE